MTSHCPIFFSTKGSLRLLVIISSNIQLFFFFSFLFQGATFPNYCAAYQCTNHSKGWEVGFDVCVCPDEQHLKVLDSAWSSSNLPRCCPQSHLTLHKDQNLLCPLSQNDKGGLITEKNICLWFHCL